MKKVFVLVSLVCLFFAATSQAQDFKPAAGAMNLELQMAPLGGTPLKIDGIRFRTFLSDKSAFRVNFFLGYHSKVTAIDSATTVGIKQEECTDKESGISFNIRPGYEMHFTGTDRLSPYWGGELDFALTTSKAVDEWNQMAKDGLSFSKVTTTTKGKSGALRIGLNLVLGCDLYIVKSFYMGAEMGFGFSLNKKSEIAEESTARDYKSHANIKQGSSFDLGPNVIGQFRIGYIF